MRQVPTVGTCPSVVGDGRVARHFLHYLTLLGLPSRAWARRAPGSGPVDALASCRTVVLLIPDSEIVPVIDAWAWLRDKRLVHVRIPASAAHPYAAFVRADERRA